MTTTSGRSSLARRYQRLAIGDCADNVEIAGENFSDLAEYIDVVVPQQEPCRTDEGLDGALTMILSSQLFVLI